MTDHATQLQQAEKRAQLLWTGIILSFFLIQAVIWTIAISITANDRSHSIVDGYDEKALNWDEERALRQASERLGWSAGILVDPAGDIRGNRNIIVKLLDADGTPLSGATINCEAFHRAVASERQPLVFTETGDGIYTTTIRVRKNGRWQFNGTAMRGGDTFVIKQQHGLKTGS